MKNHAPTSAQRALLFDRDGTLIREENYLRDPNRVAWYPEAIALVKAAHAKGYLVFVISNQSGVGRGWIQPHELEAVHREFCRQLEANGETIDATGYCVHTPDSQCGCRKPNTGLIWREFNGRPIDWAQSFVVGDKLCDLDLGANLGATSCLVSTGYGETTARELAEKPPAYRYLTLRTIDELIAHL